MQVSSQESFPSLIGVGLVADVLSDIPLPVCKVTPLEATVLGKGSELNLNTLNNSDPAFSQKINEALKSVDTSFLKLKVTPPNPNRYKAYCSSSPALIKSLLFGMSPQPKLQLKRVDTSGLTPTGTPGDTPTTKHPLNPDSFFTSGQKQANDVDATPIPSKRRRGSSIHSSDPLKKRARRLLDEDDDDTKNSNKGMEQLVVTINRSSYEQPKKKKPKRVSQPKSSFTNSPFTVSILRSKLQAPPLPISPPPPPLSLPLALPRRSIGSISDGFEIAPGVKDDPLPPQKKKKKEKKKIKLSRPQDPTHILYIQHYMQFIGSLLGDHLDLFSKPAVSQVLSETIKLKQLGVLHEVKPSLLVKLISVMDKHVLDTASLLLSVPPEEDADQKHWRETNRDRILRSLDASLIILHITTSPRVSAEVQLEESIDQVISHTKYHLENNIYPEFDLVYRNDGKAGTGALAKQKRRYTSAASIMSNKVLMSVYNRMVEVMDTLAQLLGTQALTDMTVLKLSGLGIFPFFVENISSLQLSALKLVRTIFSRYEKHRDLIIEDIFASLGRLPTTKRNLRNFRLSNGQSIQMVTALLLQLVQCIVTPPDSKSSGEEENQDPKKSKVTKMSIDVAMIGSYEMAMKISSKFLLTLMKKCCGPKVDEDFRPLFDNFVQDLLTTLSLPEWPASESLLMLLGMQLIQASSDRSNELQLRLTSLEHLGSIASRLRKDSISSIDESSHEMLIDILSEIMQKKLDGISPLPSPTGLNRMDAFSENARHLQKTLIAYLTHKTQSDPSSAYAKGFYVGLWLHDNQNELERILKSAGSSSSLLLPGEEEREAELDMTGKAVHQAEKNRDFLISLLQPMSSAVLSQLSSILDEQKSILVTRYLSSEKTFSKTFDLYLASLLKILNEPSVHVRTKAMKALSAIVTSDPDILSKPDLKRAVQSRFSDSSTLVREAAVELIGRFVLVQPKLTEQYYEMLMIRIRDSGVSVRKRVIKILKDICVNQPDFDKVTEICVQILRRILDEEGIKQLVTVIFYQLWFTSPTTEQTDQQETLAKRVNDITSVISKSTTEQECFELLLQELIKNTELMPSVLSMSRLLVDRLIEQLLSLDEISEHKTSTGLVSCVTALYLFSKIRPSFLVPHAKTLLPYLSSKCSTEEDISLVTNTVMILESVVPLLVRPSDSFLSSLQEELIKHIMVQGPLIVQSCVSCLSVVVNKVSKNYKLVDQCYKKFYNYLQKFQEQYKRDPSIGQKYKQSILRSLYSLGLFSKNFDVDRITGTNNNDTGNEESSKLYSNFIYFCEYNDPEIQKRALFALGHLCIRRPQYMLRDEAKKLYFKYLSPEAPLKIKYQVIFNIKSHLIEIESTLKAADAQRLNQSEDDTNLLEIGDQQSSVSSNIAQMYLTSILDAHYTTDPSIRLLTTQTILVILRQGLVHPGQCVPYLIALSTDPEAKVRNIVEPQLLEHSTRYGGFMQTHLTLGIKKAYQFQLLTSSLVARGYSDQSGSSLLSYLYSLVRSSKPQRRGFLQAVLRPFEDYETNSLGLLLFLADNLGTFPYLVFEEPLFVMHNVDITISVTGASVLQAFREALGQSGLAAADDREDDSEQEEDIEQLSQNSYDLKQLNDCCRSSLGCILLLLLKQHLRQVYALSDKKCQEYTPTDSNKVWEKAVSRRQGILYEPQAVVNAVEKDRRGEKTQLGKEECLKLYLHFKRLMNRLDPFDATDDDDNVEYIELPPPGSSTSLPPPIILPPPNQDKLLVPHSSVHPAMKQGSRSRTSSTSSTRSGTPALKRNKEKKSKSAKKKKKIMRVLSDDSDSGNEWS
ncbi:PREDICTED: nipped-B-like protein isoform X1 [Amphimedon queenslandica]|uniref:Nipped-B protein n=2 Tax=Amphimedon queenslandica TaxID=400682 RepID=A0AAN0JE94_AMPQE|nr:PREDICTED: nipped-B-like protein isoform X1 [Amphimedon queenslandica]|eukprot:XP_019855038.1 PREDICTED: nipped-B-like protein isoform X1 [Amphimedon queenslandica]